MAVAYNYACDLAYGFIQNPNEHQRVGYVTEFAGLGLPQALKADLTVTNPQTAANVTVVGVIQEFEWSGGVADPLQIQLYVSQENAAQLKVLQQSVLTTTKVSALNYLIIDYDQEAKRWFTQAAPVQPLSGIVPGGSNPELNVDLTPVAVAAASTWMCTRSASRSRPGRISRMSSPSPTAPPRHRRKPGAW
jgi:hypothetical protein